ncbi:hypothetical protein MmTuc01_1523 [Methanosarcina mazei Tuc01]|uniref:Uncharacterized protein n=1 Tax=Methanosarcina mazei Tuc01 TaxID=1236903 RepID=M1QIV0_METMZ|nr:hypothetical protein MmTuc01_1523 [Methanosarcina mazei Tuc01]
MVIIFFKDFIIFLNRLETNCWNKTTDVVFRKDRYDLNKY